MKLAASWSLLFGSIAIAALGGEPPTEIDNRPSVLIILADDQQADTIAALGNTVIRTPNLDRLVRRGMAFNRAYMQGSMSGATCIPSRAMLLTGQNLFRVDSQLLSDESWPQAFARAGYTTFASGKWHNGRQSLCQVFPDARAMFVGGMVDPLRASLCDVREGIAGEPAPCAQHTCAAFADATVAFLEKPQEKPFFAFLSFNGPHDPHIVPDNFAIRYDTAAIPLPPNFLPQHAWDNGEMTVRDEKLLDWPRQPEAVRQMIAEYYRFISYLDEQIGRVLDALEQSPWADNTIVVFAADSGVARGQHGLIGKQNLYEHSIRVPLVIAGPGIPAGQRSDALCYLFDLLPTAGSRCGVAAPNPSDGVDLGEVLANPKSAARESLMFAYRDVQRAVMDGQWKLIHYPKIARSQLFDLTADPWEKNNLAELPGQQPRVAELLQRLEREMRHNGDDAALSVDQPAPAEWVPPSSDGRENEGSTPPPEPTRADARQSNPHAQLPNVLLIYADDLGYGDVQCYNPARSRIPTPHLDRLAAQGMRFTDAHSSSGVCSPSRYALLTGRYHWRTRLQRGIVPLWGAPLIAPGRMTLGTLAQQHGYHTATIGKWHLGWDWPVPEGQHELFRFTPKENNAPPSADQRALWQTVFSQPIGGGPLAHGFDRYFGVDLPNHPPFCFIDDDRTRGIPAEFLPAELMGHNQASLQGPALAGWTLEPVLPALGDAAVQFLRDAPQQNRPFLLYLSLTTPHTPLAVNDEWLGKSGLNRYADLVMETDALVGRVMQALDDSGLADNTLVLFTSDNGCAPYIGVPELEKAGHFPSGPLRGYKSDAWEGGHRVPFIARWPGVVEAGSSCGQLVHQADLLRTLAGIVGTGLPDHAGEDSVNLLPLLRGSEEPVRTHAVSTSMRGVPAVRSGSWKYIPASGSGGWSTGGDPQQPVQLYNLADDLAESHNLAEELPDQVATMAALLEKLVSDGRSTPGMPQANDVIVQRFPQPQ